MGAISSLSTAGSALRRNPIILAATFISAFLGSLSLIGQALGPLASIALGGFSFIISILLTPFLVGGTVGMSAEALTGRTRLDTFLSEGKSNYVSLLGAYLLLFVTIFAVAFLFGVFAFVLMIAGVAVMSSGGGAAGGAAGLGVGIVALVVVLLAALVMLAVGFFIQFFDVAIVVSDESALGGFRRSASFVRHNVLGALGFSVLYLLVSILAGLPTIWQSFATAGFGTNSPGAAMAATGPTFVEIVPVIFATLVLSTVVSAFLWPYKVAFYVDESASGADESTTPVPGESNSATTN